LAAGKEARAMKLTFAALLAIAVGASACATLPPQIRPTSPDLFVGKWSGSWQDVGGASGSVEELTIEPPRNEALQYSVRLTNAVVPGFGGQAKFARGELVVETSTLSMVFRLHGSDRLEVSYHNRRNNSRGTWSLIRKEAKTAGPPAVTAQELTEKLVAGSPWKGEFGPRPAGTVTVSFSLSGGSLKGDLISISAGTASPGPLADLQVKGDTISFRTPGNNVYNELRLQGEKLEGTWVGTSTGWLSLSPSKP
jgi:hypothetical protein